MCTGTLITRWVVLTAAHCTKNDRTGATFSPSAFRVVFYSGAATYLAERAVSEVRPHASYDSNSLVNDIALLRLSSDAPTTVTPIPHLQGAQAVTSADLGVLLEFVGYGETQTGSTGRKLTVTNQLDKVCTSLGGCSWYLGGQSLYLARNTLCYDQTPGGPCSGDSGGPAFLLRGGQEYVAGVTSYGDQNCSWYGCSTKVDAFEGWINDFIGGVNGSSCSSAGQCNSGFCENGVCCSTACTGDCRACNLSSALGVCTVLLNGTPCGDTDPCNGLETCWGGVCTTTPTECDDGNPCTADSCQAGVGCRNTPVQDGLPCPDGDACNGEEVCQAGACRAPGPLDCDDGNPCTQDSCEPLGGCRSVPWPDGRECGQGDVCLGAGLCQAGRCVSANPLDCRDDDPCTLERCDPVLGCQYPPADCDDGNPCTLDDCLAGRGCQHTPVTDGVACGGGLCGQGTCLGGVCAGQGVPICDDGLPCTVDYCDPAVGCRARPVADGMTCGECMWCRAGVCQPNYDCTFETPTGGCGCAGAGSSGGLGPWAAGLLLLGLAPWRRR
jgi:MYXO-CTERM domain-containing protein